MKHKLMPDLNYLQSILNYNAYTGIFTWKIYRNQYAKINDQSGFYDKDGYIIISINNSYYKSHRLAFFYMYGIDFPNLEIDHRNLKRDDNRFMNLRLAKRINNTRNCDKSKNNKSGFKGVCWHKKKKKWIAQIMVNYKKIHLGAFDNIIYAAVVYRRAEKKYFGKFARQRS